MRIGQNPAKSIDAAEYGRLAPQPARVTVALITYIPFLSGYHAYSLDVLKVCLESLWANTMQPYDLLIFDNASCPEVREFLLDAHRQNRIQYLILSECNVGKGGGWNMIFQSAPGEVIAYADSDVYFYPSWLEKSVELLDNFPKAGMITSRPLRTPEIYYSSTLEWAQNTPGVVEEKGAFMTWEIYKEHTDSLGISVEQAQEWFESTYDRRVHYQDRSALIGAAHFQFVAHKKVLAAFCPFKMDRPMGQVRSLDDRLNEAGYLRLTTTERLVRHMGNQTEKGVLHRKGVLDRRSSIARSDTATRAPALRRIRNLPPVRRTLLWLYDRIFRMYFSS